MKKALMFVAKAVLGGLLVVVPIYLAVLVLLKGMKSVGAWCGHSPYSSQTRFHLSRPFLFSLCL